MKSECSICNQKFKVKYTFERTVVTLHGGQTAKIETLGCDIHKNEYISINKHKQAPLIPYCLADLNVTILIGLLRWRIGMKRHEVKAYLQRKGISLSTGNISDRSLDFLLLFKQLHYSKKEKMKAMFDEQGGTILHMDGTHKSGGKVVFVLQEGVSDIVVDASLIPSEAADNIKPILSEFKISYESPLVIVIDMGEGLIIAASEIFPNSPIQICQVHFIRAQERNLVTKYHKGLKSSIVKHKLRAKLSEIRTSDNVCNDKVALEQRWAHIAVDYVLYPVEKRVKWISRPIAYYIQYCRIKEVDILVSRLIYDNMSKNFVCGPVMYLDTCLKSVLEDRDVIKNHSLIYWVLKWLDELRDHLRISRATHLKDSSPEGVDLEGVERDIKGILAKISKEGREIGGNYSEIAKKINDSFDERWDELFVPDPVVDGKKISFRRHNNGLESSHRRTRKGIRERTGKSETNQEMEQFGDLLAIFSNLLNKTYVEKVLDDVEDLAQSLSQFVKDLPILRAEYRNARRGPEVPIADNKRMDVMMEFIEALESIDSHDQLIPALQSILGVEAV
jgi:hypothetical protein